MTVSFWKRLSDILAGFFFSLVISLMVRPWFLALAYSVDDAWRGGTFLLWLLAVLGSGILLGSWSRQQETALWHRIAGLVTFIAVHSAVLLWLGANLYLHVPFLLILFLFSLRFWLYHTIADFSFDFGFLSAFMLFTLLMQARIPIFLDAGDILLFFAAGFSLIVLFHVRNMEREGFKPHYPLLMAVMVGFVVAVLVLGTLGGLPLGVEITQVVLTVLRLAWQAISQVILWLLYPILWLLGPVMEWLTSLIPEGEQQAEETMIMQDGMWDQLESTAAANGTSWSVPPWVYWIGGVIVLVLVIVLMLRKLQIPRDDEEEGVEEERESVFSQESLARDLRDLMQSGRKWLRRIRPGGATPTDPVGRVRWSYRRFLEQLRTLHPRPDHLTPRAYQERLERNAAQDQPLRDLTGLYQRARYRRTATTEEAEQAEKAADALKAAWKLRKD